MDDDGIAPVSSTSSIAAETCLIKRLMPRHTLGSGSYSVSQTQLEQHAYAIADCRCMSSAQPATTLAQVM